MRYLLLLTLGVVSSGCVNLTAVGDFAKECSLISSNKAYLDDTDAQNEAREYDNAHHIEDRFIDPASKPFTDRLAVTAHALNALNEYMNILAQLSANDAPNVSSDLSPKAATLKSLKVTDPAAQAGLNAAQSLTGILLDGAVRHDVKALIKAAAAPVDEIAMYLTAQAQTTSNTYTQAIAVNNQYWNELTVQSAEDVKLCKSANLCKSIYRLANRARDEDNAKLSAKAAAADAAVNAFKKIRTDNAALVANLDTLSGKTVVAILKRDEPDLLTAVRNVKSL